jgi:hypothetical protein
MPASHWKVKWRAQGGEQIRVTPPVGRLGLTDETGAAIGDPLFAPSSIPVVLK